MSVLCGVLKQLVVMASSEILQLSKESFLSLFWSTLREAEAAAPKENNAALSIQRVYRGTIGRERIAKRR